MIDEYFAIFWCYSPRRWRMNTRNTLQSHRITHLGDGGIFGITYLGGGGIFGITYLGDGGSHRVATRKNK